MKRRHNLLIVTLLLGMFVRGTVAAAVYYVAPGGNDESSGSLARPWKTPQKAATVAVAGDTIYLRAGTYRNHKPIKFAHSGADTAPITMSGFPGETAVINGMADLSAQAQWTAYKSDVYYTSQFTVSGFDKDIRLVVQNDKVLEPRSSVSGLTTKGTFYFDKATHRLYVRSLNGGNPGRYQTQISQSDSLIEFGPTSQHIIIENLTLTGGYYGIQCQPNGGNRTFRNLGMRHFKNDAIKFHTTGNHDDLVENCNFSSYGDFGIDTYGSSNQVFRNNEFKGVLGWRGGGAVKSLADSNHLVIEGNYIHDLGGRGWAAALELRESKQVKVINNLIVRVEGSGISIYGNNSSLSSPVPDPASREISIVNNTIYNTKLPAIWLMKSSMNITVRNNIIFQRSGCSFNLRVDSGAETDFVSNFNNYYRFSGPAIRWLSSSYSTSEFTQVANQEANSFFKDPRFINTLASDFHLLPDSPDIDRGGSEGASGRDKEGVPRPQGKGFDIGAYEYYAIKSFSPDSFASPFPEAPGWRHE